jgi:ferrous iron transport protein B
VPLASCSARLPIYILVIASIFPAEATVMGLSMGAMVLFGVYAFSAVSAIGAAAVLRRTVLKGPRPTMVLELPPYRWPAPRNLLASILQKLRAFLVEAGTVILALTIVLWALLNFPRSEAVTRQAEAERRSAEVTLAEGPVKNEVLAGIEQREAGERLRHSLAGRMGRVIEPVFEPLGFDWRIDIGILGAFAAREVFVSTLGLVFDVGGEADEDSQPLRKALADARRPDGSKLWTPLTGVSLIVFFVFACQCMSTIAVVRRESGSWRWPAFMFAYMTALAYLMALLVYQGGRLLGFG